DSIFRKRIISWTPTDSVTESIAVCNPGTFPLTFEDWGINSDDNAWQDYTIIHMPSTIAPGQCDSIVIQFKPDEFNFRPAFLDILTNAVDTPNFEFDLVGTGGLSQVTSYPSSLFGTNIVPANGQEEVDTVWVCNDGTPGVYAEIHVTDVVLDNHDSCYSVVKGINNRILPGNCDYFLVKFKPTSGGAKSGTLTFKTNTRAFPVITVNLGGVGGVRLIASDTSSLSFADTVGCPTTSTQCFVISNPGTLSTTVDSLSIAGVTPNDYSVQGTLPVTLAPGAHDTLCVTFAPTVEGADSATLTLVNNSFNATSGYPVQLSGLGLAAQVSYSTKQIIRTVLPLNQTFDTSITIYNSGNIPAFVFPNISDINHWNLILPFTQTFSDSTVLNIRHLKTLNPRIDTLFVVLTWGNAGLNGLQGCGTSHTDTIEFIEQFGPNRVDEQSQIASSFSLLQNYPNPFNPVTNIEYAIPQRANVTLTVYNMLGEAVQTLVNESEDMGTYKATFDASNLPNGNYYYELRAGSFMKRMMMTLAK
ncbi:MAG TPA: choice-of-anchor D domain-containing protein, partial [Candidatus Kapabacteria bacterium]|nr:choice-of-anchor D domain-containing protein [Candidatus Kapabacteria bacterium]